MITKNGVCYDLSLSNYRLTVDGITYVFSSQLHLNKFKERMVENRNSISKSLSNRFGFTIEASTIADIVLYKKVETRGFFIVTNEDIELWQISSIKCVGGKLIPLISNEQ